MASGLRTSARAITDHEPTHAKAGIVQLRAAQARSADLVAARAEARKVATRTVRGRRRTSLLREVDRGLESIDLLVAESMALAEHVRRLTEQRGPRLPWWLAVSLGELAAGADAVANHCGDPSAAATGDQPGLTAADAALTQEDRTPT